MISDALTSDILMAKAAKPEEIVELFVYLGRKNKIKMIEIYD